MKALCLLCAAFLVSTPQLAHAQTAPLPTAQMPSGDAEADYQALLAAAKSTTGTVDWQGLRYAFADRPAFTGTSDDDDRMAMFKAANGGDWPAAQAAAQRVIDQVYVDGMAHYVLSAAYVHAGKPDEAARERAIGEGLLQSIKTGDGLSYDTAFTVIAISEEYDLMTFLGVHLDQQALDNHNGHMFDVMHCEDQKGQKITYYFNIDREWAAEARMFAPKK